MDQSTPDAVADRAAFLRGVATTGMGVTAARFGLRMPALSSDDRAILHAAQLAEALAVTTYTHIISAPFFARLFPQDQSYLRAAREEEMAHYAVVQSLTGLPAPSTPFYYPKGMFTSAPTTLNTVVVLEEAFIAAYLVGVRHFSTPDLRVAAARIAGIESDHRTMTRVLAPGLDPTDGGPLRTLAGVKGTAEPVDPASNNGFERTLGWTNVNQVVAALQPFLDQTAARRAHFDTTRPYTFTPFTPTLPTPFGAF